MNLLQAHLFTVARIPVIVHAPVLARFDHRLQHAWRGDGDPEEPLHLFFGTGPLSADELRPILGHANGGAVFALDQRGELAVAVRGNGGALHHQLMTRRAGYEYELRFARVEDIAEHQWMWPRDAFRYALPSRQRGLMAHACGFALDGDVGILCPGISGAGKSTLGRVVTLDEPGAVTVLSDERIAITTEGDELVIWGTPWFSSASLSADAHAPLRAVVFPGRGGSPPLFRDVPPREAAHRLMRTLAFPVWSGPLMEFAFSLVERMVGAVPAFEFAYFPAPGAGTRLIRSLRAALSSKAIA